MQLGKLGLGPAKVLDGGVEGSVSHFASCCECGEVSEVAEYVFKSATYDLKQGNRGFIYLPSSLSMARCCDVC